MRTLLFWEERDVMVYGGLAFTKGQENLSWNQGSEIEPTWHCQKVVSSTFEGWVSTIDKMVGESKGKKGKEHGLSCGINRNSTHEYGNNNSNLGNQKSKWR